MTTRPAAELEPVDMARLMVGRELLALYPPRAAAPAGEPAFEVSHFTAPGFAEDAGFSVRPGEILGFGRAWSARDAPNCSRRCSAFAKARRNPSRRSADSDGPTARRDARAASSI